MARTQPVKALRLTTSGRFPQLARRNAVHASKSNRGVPAKTALSSLIGSAAKQGRAWQPQPMLPHQQAPFSLLMKALLLLSISSLAHAERAGDTDRPMSCKAPCGF